MNVNILLFDIDSIETGSAVQPLLHFKITGKNIDKKSMGLSQLLLHEDYGIIFSGKSYDKDDEEAGVIADISKNNYDVRYIKRPAFRTVSAFAIKEISTTSYELAFFVNEQKDDDYKNYNSEGVRLNYGTRNLSPASFTNSWVFCTAKKVHGSALVHDGTHLLAAFYGGESSSEFD